MQKYLIITGASKGIGFATAELFLKNNYQVINISRSNCSIQNVININVDLLSNNWEHIVLKKINETIPTNSEICLVHNSALLEKDSVYSIKKENFRSVLELNVIVPSILNQLILPLCKSNSSIIYVGSTLSEKAVKNSFSYVTSKHALVGLMRSTCQDLEGSEIHTVCLCPGFTDTEMLRAHVGNDPEVIKYLESIICGHRLIKPEEIAKTIYFCAVNPILNGSVIHANLGNIER